MRIRISRICLVSKYLLMPLTVLGFCGVVTAQCLGTFSAAGTEQQATVVALDAISGCTAISGQYGCSIKNPALNSQCSFTRTDSFGQPRNFTAVVTGISASKGLTWTVTGNVNIDTAIVGGGSQGKNNCGAFYTYDVASGSGGDCKSSDASGRCIELQNITRLDICSDFQDESPPPPPPVAEGLPSCGDIGNQLDQTGIQCPTDTSPAVVCNLEKDKDDWGASDGSPVCCTCNIDEPKQACVVTVENASGTDPECTTEMTVDPTQTVEITFFRSDGDPCGWIRTASGWRQTCW